MEFSDIKIRNDVTSSDTYRMSVSLFGAILLYSTVKPVLRYHKNNDVHTGGCLMQVKSKKESSNRSFLYYF